MKVCILAAGLGSRMGAISDSFHKGLLPLGNEAVISRIINYFPRTAEFVIAIGNKSDQIKAFLEFAHPEKNFQFVDVDPYQGPGSGPGFSLFCCRELLREPFYFTACDTLILDQLPDLASNWLAVAPVNDPHNWCTTLVDNDMKVRELEYKSANSQALFAFSGLAYVKNFDVFWQALENESHSRGEIQVNSGLSALIAKELKAIPLSWEDTGNWDSYQRLLTKFPKNLSFTGKATEITYLYENRIIKLYSDETKAKKWHARGQTMGGLTPKLLGQHGPLTSYAYEEGMLLSRVLNASECLGFLEWMQREFWSESLSPDSRFESSLEEFYITKSSMRINQFENLHPDSTNIFRAPVSINGLLCEPALKNMDKVSSLLITNAIPSRFHGDLHGDNVIKTARGYRLIDWRDSFGGLDYGDRYYDLAKFLHTLDLSVETMDTLNFQVSQGADEISLNHRCEYRELEARDAFWSFIDAHGYSRPRVELLNAIIFLNMSPLYKGDLSFYLYYLGRYQLQKCINELEAKSFEGQQNEPGRHLDRTSGL